MLLLLLAACSTSKARSELIGFWESASGKTASSVEFMADGTVVFAGNALDLLDWKVMKLLRDFNLKPAGNSMTFKVLDKEHIEIQADFLPLLEKLSAGAPPGAKPGVDVAEFRPRETLTFAVSGADLTLSSERGKSLKFRRSD
jgi:hypothetical protein